MVNKRREKHLFTARDLTRILLTESHQKTKGPTEDQCVELITDLSVPLSVLTLVLDTVDEFPLHV